MRTWTAKEFKHIPGAPLIAEDADASLIEIDTNWRYFKVAEVQEGDVVLPKSAVADMQKILLASLSTVNTLILHEDNEREKQQLRASANAILSLKSQLEGK